MANYNKFSITVQDFARGINNFSTTTVLKVMLSNTLPTATMNTSTEITQISTLGGYTVGGSAVVVTSSIQSSGTYILKANPLVFTATSTGPTATFEYAVLYNSTAVTSSTINGSSAPLIGWYDYGSGIALNASETLTITWDASSGVLQFT
jgi:hypothetical protein